MSEEWIVALAEACDRSTQRQVSNELGVSAAMVNQALKGTYKGDVERLRRLVEGKYMRKTVECPVLGTIAKDVCLWHQEREFAATNQQRILLYQACRGGCINSRIATKSSSTGERIAVRDLAAGYDVEQYIESIHRKADGDPAVEVTLLRNELRKLASRTGGQE